MPDEQKQTNKKFYKRWWFWAIVMLVLIILGRASTEKSEQPSTVEPTTPDAALETAPAEEPETSYIDAYDIISAYVENTVTADSLYRDKTLEIQGKVSDIGKDLIDTPFLTIRGSRFTFEGMRCNFSKADEDLLMNVEKNQDIVVRGKIEGEKLGTVLVSNCEIVE